MAIFESVAIKFWELGVDLFNTRKTNLGKSRILALSLIFVASVLPIPAKALASKATDPTVELMSPPSRLTFVLYSVYFESYLQEEESRGRIAQKIQSMFSLGILDRRLAFEEFFEFWAKEIESDLKRSRLDPMWPHLRSDYVFRKWTAIAEAEKLSHPRARKKFVKRALEQWGSDLALSGFAQLIRSESHQAWQERAPDLLQISKNFSRAPDASKVAHTLSAILYEASKASGDSKSREIAKSALMEVVNQHRRENSISISSPEVFLFGGPILKWGGSLLARSPKVLAILGSKAPSAVTALAGSAALHGAVLSKATEQKGLSDKDAAEVARLNPIQEYVTARRSQFSTANGKSDAISLERFREMLQSGLQSDLDPKRYAELIALGEMLIPNKSREISRTLGMGFRPRDYIAIQSEVASEVSSYLKAENRTVLTEDDVPALVKIISRYYGPHEDGRAFATPTALNPVAEPGNCVSRALIVTSFLYPAIEKHLPAGTKFGLMYFLNHIEPVLRFPNTYRALALTTNAEWWGHKPHPAILHPKALLASYLFRMQDKNIFGDRTQHVEPLALPARDPLILVPAANIPKYNWESFDEDLNPNPFVSAQYSDPIRISEQQRRELYIGATGGRGIRGYETEADPLVFTTPRPLGPLGFARTEYYVVHRLDVDKPAPMPAELQEEIVASIADFMQRPLFLALESGKTLRFSEIAIDSEFVLGFTELNGYINTYLKDKIDRRSASQKVLFDSTVRQILSNHGFLKRWKAAEKNLKVVLEEFRQPFTPRALERYFKHAETLDAGGKFRAVFALHLASIYSDDLERQLLVTKFKLKKASGKGLAVKPSETPESQLLSVARDAAVTANTLIGVNVISAQNTPKVVFEPKPMTLEVDETSLMLVLLFIDAGDLDVEGVDLNRAWMTYKAALSWVPVFLSGQLASMPNFSYTYSGDYFDRLLARIEPGTPQHTIRRFRLTFEMMKRAEAEFIRQYAPE